MSDSLEPNSCLVEREALGYGGFFVLSVRMSVVCINTIYYPDRGWGCSLALKNPCFALSSGTAQ